ncbi:hypothetical protein, partial [Paenibacillus pabuli]
MDIVIYIIIAIVSFFLIYRLIIIKKNMKRDWDLSIITMENDFKNYLELKERFNTGFHTTLNFSDKAENLLEYYLTMPWMTLNKRDIYFKIEERNNNNSSLYEYLIYTLAAFALIYSIISILKLYVLP